MQGIFIGIFATLVIAWVISEYKFRASLKRIRQRLQVAQQIEQAALKHTISKQEIAEAAEVLGTLADHGIQWREALEPFFEKHPELREQVRS